VQAGPGTALVVGQTCSLFGVLIATIDPRPHVGPTGEFLHRCCLRGLDQIWREVIAVRLQRAFQQQPRLRSHGVAGGRLHPYGDKFSFQRRAVLTPAVRYPLPGLGGHGLPDLLHRVQWALGLGRLRGPSPTLVRCRGGVGPIPSSGRYMLALLRRPRQ
jgi:hypothetical protein